MRCVQDSVMGPAASDPVSDAVSVSPPPLSGRRVAKSPCTLTLVPVFSPFKDNCEGTSRLHDPGEHSPAASHRPPPCPDGACASRRAGSGRDTGCGQTFCSHKLSEELQVPSAVKDEGAHGCPWLSAAVGGGERSGKTKVKGRQRSAGHPRGCRRGQRRGGARMRPASPRSRAVTPGRSRPAADAPGRAAPGDAVLHARRGFRARLARQLVLGRLHHLLCDRRAGGARPAPRPLHQVRRRRGEAAEVRGLCV